MNRMLGHRYRFASGNPGMFAAETETIRPERELLEKNENDKSSFKAARIIVGGSRLAVYIKGSGCWKNASGVYDLIDMSAGA